MPSRGAERSPAEAEAVMRVVLDGIPAQTAWSVPIYGPDGEIDDFEVRAAGPHAKDVHGRVGKELIGVRTAGSYPSTRDTPLWRAYLRVMRTGEPEDVVRYEHVEAVEGVRHRSTYTVRVTRVLGGLLAAWTSHEDEDRLVVRLAITERLGNLGWGRWSLVTGEIEWSSQLYAIHGRDPADGPLDLRQYRAITHPEDLPIIDEALATLAVSDSPHEFEIRVRVGGELRLIRAVTEVGRDGAGRPIEMHGLIQDITDWRRTTDELAVATRRLAEESRLTAELQHIIMPVQEDFLTLPGLRVAVRYDAAATAPLGGDWYQAIHLDDDEALLAVGDVAGNGLPAASAMAKLRHAITGLAFADKHPDEILVALNRLLRRLRPDVLATAVVARFRPRDRTLTFTHAGHPPMLLVRGRSVRRLLHPGVLLGVFDDVEYTRATVRMEPGDLLVMFTDGLIELPGRDLFEGLDDLAATIAGVVAADPPDRLAAVMDALVPSNTGDDTCILVAQLTMTTLDVA
ncbi:PP2C family protein-serine/threonine phosphatase [Sphaerisporangium album]|uniref:PP2C family protein-serine/threonine phosphatase n=1 Tax=Sphaerisporangium album TaxID=509200 RepID=UPI0011C01DAA|nr:PP2C family protein-serine/threonine phosphatase [Sphaerisporangium album]